LEKPKIAGSIGIRSNNTPLAVCLHLQITANEHDFVAQFAQRVGDQ
jgi:hypothetical protein